MFVFRMVCMRTTRLKRLEVCAVKDSRAREAVISSLMQPGVDMDPWVTRTEKACTVDIVRFVAVPRVPVIRGMVVSI
jgi:hypothetical protein